MSLAGAAPVLLPEEVSALASNRAPIGISNILAIWGSRPAPTRFGPFSYFCICWNETPSRRARLLWDMPPISPWAGGGLPLWMSAEVASRVIFVIRKILPLGDDSYNAILDTYLPS